MVMMMIAIDNGIASIDSVSIVDHDDNDTFSFGKHIAIKKTALKE